MVDKNCYVRLTVHRKCLKIELTRTNRDKCTNKNHLVKEIYKMGK